MFVAVDTEILCGAVEELRIVDVLHPRCAGVDVSKRDAKVCVRVAGQGRAGASSMVTTWASVTNQVLALREHLIEAQVTLVVMEATGDYWKPFYYLLEDGPFQVLLVNVRQVKNLPGRKTDVSDAAWLAQLGAHGLVRGSFVPPEPIRQLRDLTRTTSAVTSTPAATPTRPNSAPWTSSSRRATRSPSTHSSPPWLGESSRQWRRRVSAPDRASP